MAAIALTALTGTLIVGKLPFKCSMKLKLSIYLNDTYKSFKNANHLDEVSFGDHTQIMLSYKEIE